MKNIYSYFNLIIPSNRLEYILFSFILIIYILLGSYFAFYSNIIYNNEVPWDIYLSFDNSFTAQEGGFSSRHPLSFYFFTPLNVAISYIFNNNIHYISFAYVILCSTLVSLNIILVFKYLRNIILLSIKTSILLIVFYSFFTTNIVLAFTPENYTLSLFLLSFYTYASAIILKKGEKISTSFAAIMTTLVGGITITNTPKIFLPFLFENKHFNLKAIKEISLKIFICLFTFISISLIANINSISKFYEQWTTGYKAFSEEENGFISILIRIVSYFFGSNMLFSSFFTYDFEYLNIKYKGLYPNFHDQLIHYIFFLIIFLFLIGGIIMNRKNKFVIILSLCFLSDVVLHCFFKFGLSLSFIYGGHWIFIFPLLIGWFFKAISNKRKIYKINIAILTLAIIYLIINNSYRMINFIEFVNKYYRV